MNSRIGMVSKAPIKDFLKEYKLLKNSNFILIQLIKAFSITIDRPKELKILNHSLISLFFLKKKYCKELYLYLGGLYSNIYPFWVILKPNLNISLLVTITLPLKARCMVQVQWKENLIMAII